MGDVQLTATQQPVGTSVDFTAALKDRRLVQAGTTNLYKGIWENKNGATIYICFWDAKQTSDVTVGTTPVKFSIPVPSNGFADEDIAALPMSNFKLGCVIAATAAADGSGGLVTTGGLSTVFFR